MISKLRLEAEGTTLDEVLKDIEAATKAAKLPKHLQISDEHYERVHDTLFRGRRVFGGEPKVTVQHPLGSGGIQRSFPYYAQSISATSQNLSVAVPKVATPHSDPK